MNAFWEAVVSNAALVGLLAVAVGIATRWVRRPEVVYWLWLVVLLKLVTPPLLQVPIPWGLGERTAAAVSQSTGLAPSAADRTASAELTEPTESHRFAGPASAHFARQQSLPAGGGTPSSLHSSTGQVRGMLVHIPWSFVLLGVWLCGSLGWFSLAALRLVRFGRVIGRSKPAAEHLQATARQVSQRLKIRRCPEVRVLQAHVPPLLWWSSRRPVIVLPSDLLEWLESSKQAALVAHELAHYRRRDHLIRWITTIILGIYWWHPAVWWAQRRIQQAEEECCDAWVVWALPGQSRSYAGTLLDTINFLSLSDSSLPIPVSGLGHVGQLKRRVELILADTAPLRMSWGGLLALVVLAGLILPWSLRASSADEPAEKTIAAQGAAAVKPTSDAPKPEEKKVASPLVGSWQVVSGSVPAGKENKLRMTTQDRGLIALILGKAFPRQDSTVSAVVSERTITFRQGEKTLGEMSYVLDTKLAPWTIDMQSKDGVMLGICTQKGDDVEIRLNDQARGRPSESDEDQEGMVLVMRPYPVTEPVRCVTFSADGKTLATSGGPQNGPGDVTLWDLAARKPIWRTPRPGGSHAPFFTPDGKMLPAASLFESDVGLLDAATGELRGTLHGPAKGVFSMAISPDGTTLAVGFVDGTIKLWDITAFQGAGSRDATSVHWGNHEGHERLTLSAHKGDVISMAFSPDGKTLFSGGDVTARLWNAKTGKEERVIQRSEHSVSRVGFSPDGHWAIVGNWDNLLQIYDLASGKLRVRIEGRVFWVSYSPDGRALAICDGQNPVVRVYRLDLREPTAEESKRIEELVVMLSDDSSAVREMAGGALKQMGLLAVPALNKAEDLASGEVRKRVQSVLTAAATLQPWALLKSRTDGIHMARFSPDGKTIAGAGWDTTVQLWDLESQQVVGTLGP